MDNAFWRNLLFEQVASQTPTLEPQTPGTLRATAGNQSVALNWVIAAGTQYYEVWREAGTTDVMVTTTTTNSYTVTGLTNGTAYQYYVVSVIGSKKSAPSNTVTSTPNSGGSEEVPPDGEGGGNVAGDYYNVDGMKFRRVNPNYDIESEPTAIKNVFKGAYNHAYNETMTPNEMRNSDQINGPADQYTTRMTGEWCMIWANIFLATGAPQALDVVAKTLRIRLEAGVTTTYKEWPGELSAIKDTKGDNESNSYDAPGVNVWPQSSKKSWRWFINVNQNWIKNYNYKRILYLANNKPGYVGQPDVLPNYGTDLTVFDEEIGMGYICFFGWLLEVNRDLKAASGTKAKEDWGAIADSAYYLMKDRFDSYYARTDVVSIDLENNATAIRNFINNGTIPSGAVKPYVTRHANKYFSNFQDITHGASTHAFYWMCNYVWRIKKENVTDSDSRKAYRSLFKLIRDNIYLADMPTDINDDISPTITNLANLKIASWPHQLDSTGAHTASYQALQTGLYTAMHMIEMPDTNGNKLTRDYLEAMAMTQGFVYLQDSNMIKCSGGCVGRPNGTQGNLKKVMIHTGASYLSKYSGTNLTNGFGEGQYAQYMAFDPTSSNYVIKNWIRRCKGNSKVVDGKTVASSRYDLQPAMTNSANTVLRKNTAAASFLFMLVMNRDITLSSHLDI